MNLQKFINERLHISSDTKSIHVKTTLFPKDRDELKAIIRGEIERQGPDADLNHIDTSQITDMSRLFTLSNIGNIKIEQWDVSNVTNMSFMFTECFDFTSDLSNWDVSNVTNMLRMFNGCRKFTSDLSS